MPVSICPLVPCMSHQAHDARWCTMNMVTHLFCIDMVPNIAWHHQLHHINPTTQMHVVHLVHELNLEPTRCKCHIIGGPSNLWKLLTCCLISIMCNISFSWYSALVPLASSLGTSHFTFTTQETNSKCNHLFISFQIASTTNGWSSSWSCNVNASLVTMACHMILWKHWPPWWTYQLLCHHASFSNQPSKHRKNSFGCVCIWFECCCLHISLCTHG
jgi:hypothetical protein